VVKRVKYSFQDNFPYVFSPCSCRQGEFKKPQPIPSHSRAGDRYIKYARKCASAGAKHPDALAKRGRAVTKNSELCSPEHLLERKKGMRLLSIRKQKENY